jgi:hypothetical protein
MLLVTGVTGERRLFLTLEQKRMADQASFFMGVGGVDRQVASTSEGV